MAPFEGETMSGKPFFRTREVILSDPFDAYIVKMRTLQRRYAYETWPMARLRRYIDMLCEFGFNSLQLSDLSENYAASGYALTPGQFAAKLHWLSDYAKSKGMTRTLFVWGTGAVDVESSRGKLLDWSFWHPCPCVKGGQAALDKHYRCQARHAPWFDHFVSHWADPGGCHGGKCTLATALGLHNQMAAEFRKHNPSIRSTFSLWTLHLKHLAGQWRGYESVESILDAGVLDEGVGLAQHGRFRLAEAQKIAASGRPVGVWSWYLADDEVEPSIHVHTELLGDYFNRISTKASSLVSWHSMDSNCHALNVPSLYVAAQLLVDPYRDPEKLLAEFCARAFGKSADGFAEGLLAIAKTRCENDYMRIEPLLTGTPWRGLPDERQHPDKHLAIVRRARKAVARLKADKSFRPDLPLIITAETFLEELKAHLKIIEEFAVFRIALRKAGKLKGAIDASRLPALKRPGRLMTQFEYKLYREHLDVLKKEGQQARRKS